VFFFSLLTDIKKLSNQIPTDARPPGAISRKDDLEIEKIRKK